jgi:superfamily II DNA or RNA helicase
MLVEQLLVPDPRYQEAQAAGRSLYGLKEFITSFLVMPDDSLVIPRGMRSWLLRESVSFVDSIEIVDNRKLFNFKQIDSSKIKYRPYQAEAVMNLMTTGPDGVLVAPAGSGKTIMGLSLIPLTGQPTIWLTHTGTLARQAIDRAESFLPDIGDVGLIGQGEWRIGDKLTVALIQTLVRNLGEVTKMRDRFGLAIVDEGHHTPSRTFTEVVSRLASYYLYALTATPYRRDGLEQLMFQYTGMDSTIVPIGKVKDHGGIIVPSVLVREVPSVKVEDNDIQKILKEYIVENPIRNKMIVEDVLNEAKQDKFCIVISDRRKHCEYLYKNLKNAWPKTGIATGKYTKKQITEQVEKFNNNEITILVATFSLLGEGFDVPFLDRAFITMPFRAEAKAEQLIGRIQRYFPGKEDAIVYDYVDSNIGVLKNQFRNARRECRYRVYERLGVNVIH